MIARAVLFYTPPVWRVRMRMVKLGVVRPQEILAVVIAVRRAHQRVNMVARRHVAVEHGTGLVIEFDQYHGL